MRCEIPVVLRCCFCFPLRPGLLVWAYLKQIFSLCYLINMICNAVFNFAILGKRLEDVWTPAYMIIQIILFIFMILDIMFLTLFIISAHTKNYRTMEIFYRYRIVVLCLEVVVLGLTIAYFGLLIHNIPLFFAIILGRFMVAAVIIILLSICFEGYLVILVRSEFIKLKNNSQFQYVNRAADEQCIANIDFLKEISENV